MNDNTIKYNTETNRGSFNQGYENKSESNSGSFNTGTTMLDILMEFLKRDENNRRKL